MFGRRENQTLTKGVAKVPVMMQLEWLECGAASLGMVLAYYGKWVPLEQLRADCSVSRDGVNAEKIYLAAKLHDLDVKVYKMTPESLKENGRFPCIIHWNMNHFVVLKGFRGKYVYLNDPARGAIRVTWEEFDESFTGIAIVPVPSERFRPGGKPASLFSFVKKRLAGMGAALAFVALTTLIFYLFNITNSVAARIFVDKLLIGRNDAWIRPFLCILLALAAVQIAAEWVRAVYSLRINGKMAAIGSTTYMWKVLRLPLDFFVQRRAGDIQARAVMNTSIAGTFVNTLAPLIMNTLIMILYLVLMLRQSLLLSLIGIAVLVLNVVLSIVISRRRIDITRVRLRDEGKRDSTALSGIDMIEAIKASGAENSFFRRWSGYLASVNRQSVRAEKNEQYLGMLPAFLVTLANYAVLALGVLLTMQGKFTLGAVLMFQGFMSAFLSPAMMAVKAGQTMQEMRTQMERVEDVMQYPEDESLEESAKDDRIADRKLKGGVELKNVTFGYSRASEPVVKDFSLSVRPGQWVALVGPSGCGKSTIAGMIAGLYQPWSGEVLLDGRPRNDYPRDVITNSLSVVDQQPMLFEGTVSSNIKMWDASIQDFEVIIAARDAAIHKDITEMVNGYRHKLKGGGRNLSGGQRQRLEIARALALDPSVLILDEATAALDAETEYEVIKAIRNRGITCIVISHRLSAIRDCDEIIVLDHGRAVERGTHQSLMEQGGRYAELIANES